jgi:GNAT superfamily N-acetyltransferase
MRDLFSYRYDFARDVGESGFRTRRELRNRISFRPIFLSRDTDVDLIITLFNAGWNQSWGFVPLLHREFSSLSKLLKPVMTEEFAFFIILDGKPIGFAIVIPNLFDLVNDLGGKILPFGAIRLVSRIIKARFHSARLDLLGLEPSFHRTAIGGAIMVEVIAELIRRATNAGISHVELGWVLEENEAMRRIVEWSGGLPDKVHRIYQKHLKHAQVS